MADVTTAHSATPDAVAPKKGKKDKKTARPKSSHPTTAVMVSNAIKNLKERGGSSLQAIKKYIAATYKVDTEKMSPFIKKYLKSSVVSGALVQTKGKGASGSFKLAIQSVTKPAAKASKTRKPPAVKTSPKKPGRKPAKKAAKPKKAPIKKPASPKPAVKSPVKAKKTAKAPTKKPKSPKAKTSKASKAKKAAPKKK